MCFYNDTTKGKMEKLVKSMIVDNEGKQNTYIKGIKNAIYTGTINTMKEAEKFMPEWDKNKINKSSFTEAKYYEHVQYIKNNLNKNIIDRIDDYNSSSTNVPHTTLDDDAPFEFFKKVYENWRNMSSDARDFYRQHINIYGKNYHTDIFNEKNNEHRNKGKLNDWVQLTEDEILELANKKLGTTNQSLRDKLRVNLMKEEAGSKKVKFESNLPVIPHGHKAWYSTKTGLEYVEGYDDNFL